MRLLPAAGFAVLAVLSGWTGRALGARATAPRPDTSLADMERRERVVHDSLLALYRTHGDALDPRTLGLVGFTIDIGLRDWSSGFGSDSVRYEVPRDTAEGRRLLLLAEARGDTLASQYLWMIRARRYPETAAHHVRTAARRGARWAARYAVAEGLRTQQYDSLAALLAHSVAGPSIRLEAETMYRTTDSVATASGDSTARRMADALAGLLGR